MSTTWRLERVKRKAGTAYVLRTRTADGGRTVPLGVVEDADAQRAVDALRALGDQAEGWVTWYDRDRKGALAGLLSEDPASAVLASGRDWSRVALRTYFREVYAPWRSRTVASWRAERGIWTRILRELGGTRLRDLDPWVVADYLDELRIERAGDPRRGQPMTGNTKRLHRAAIQALLKRAHRLRHLHEVPDLGTFRLAGSTKARPRRAPLSSEEIKALLNACGPQLRAMVSLCALAGLRPSEAARVRWEDFDWQVPALFVRGTKTEIAAAGVPLLPPAVPPVSAWWEACDRPTAGLAFHSQRSGEAYGPGGWRKALATAALAAGITRPVTPYLLRATFATVAWRSGVERDVTARIMRHTSPRMLDEVYARPHPADLAARASRFTL